MSKTKPTAESREWLDHVEETETVFDVKILDILCSAHASERQQCCKHDHDHDGNCHVHSGRGRT